MSQLVTRIDDDLAREIDALVEEGVVESRSDAVRQALRELIDRHRRRKIGEAIVRDLEQARANLQLAYAKAVTEDQSDASE